MKNLFDKIIYHAITQNATDIHLYLQQTFTITFRIYGKIIPYMTMENEEGEHLINYIKYKAHINTNYKLANQTGEFNISFNHSKYCLRVSCLPAKNMKSLVIRILYPDSLIQLNRLTPQTELIRNLKDLLKNKSGLFIVSGPTGSGKSTTLYSLITELNKNKDYNIITVEDPVEISIEQCLQIELNEELGITYKSSLKQILRHDPDVIIIGEIRDEETAKIAITCALTGHLVLTTVHSSNVEMTILRLINLNVSDYELQSVIIGILSQRLIHDYKNRHSFMIGEYCNKQQFLHYIKTSEITYPIFKAIKKHLISKGYNRLLFEHL